MNIHVKYEKSDWYAFNQYLVRISCKEARTIFDNFFVNVFIWIVITIVARLSFEQITDFHIPTSLLTTGILVAVYLELAYKNKKRRKVLEPSENGTFLGEHEFQFEGAGFRTISRSSECNYKWDVVLKIERADGMIMLFVDTIKAFILPEKQLDNPDEVYQKLLEFIGTNTN